MCVCVCVCVCVCERERERKRREGEAVSNIKKWVSFIHHEDCICPAKWRNRQISLPVAGPFPAVHNRVHTIM